MEAIEMVGKTFLHYRIIEKIGEGGMGMVYKAVDTHLDRPVAIKVLPADKIADSDRKRRFVQEAKAASSLRHPNIVVIHDITADQGIDFIVMEYIEGQSLDRIIGRKGMKLSEALGYGVQIADGLAKAHAAGLVHRDLKPTNLMVTGDGLVKILDFGLAKLMEGKDDVGAARTMTLGHDGKPETELGFIVGTAAYMSPEQAEGKDIDARSDIFSFGTVLYEMLTGRKAFGRESGIKTLAAVIKEDPKPATALNEDIPPEMENVLNRCIRKEPQRRWQTMSDLKVTLIDLKEESESGRLQATSIAPRRNTRRMALFVAAAIFVIAAAIVLIKLVPMRPEAAPEFSTRPLTFDSGLSAFPAVWADGNLMAYASDRGEGGDFDIWIKQIDGGRPLQRTNHPADDVTPSLSPDGSRIAFRSERDGGGIYITDALSGEPRLLVKGGYAPRFSPDGALISYVVIPASNAQELVKMYLISPQGGGPEPFLPDFCFRFAGQGASLVWSPGGKHLLFSGQPVNDPSAADWWVASVDGGEPIRTHAVANLDLTAPVQMPTAWVGSYIYYVHGTTVEGINVHRAPIDLDNWRISGPSEPLTTGPGMKFWSSVAPDGRILFTDMMMTLDSWYIAAKSDEAVITSDSRKLTQDLMQKFSPSVSRDGTKIAYHAFGGVQAARTEVRMRDLSTGQETIIQLAASLGSRPRLSPDGSILAYRDFVSGQWHTYVVPFGSVTSREICDSCRVLDFFPGGDFALVKIQSNSLERMDLNTGEKTPVFAVTSDIINDARLSPDGKWLACLIGKPDGRAEIQLAPVDSPQAGERSSILVIEDDRYLSRPEWSPNGRFLYFLSQMKDTCSIFAQELDPLTMEPSGAARKVFTAQESRFSLNYPIGGGGISVAADKIIFWTNEMTGNIYLAETKSR